MNTPHDLDFLTLAAERLHLSETGRIVSSIGTVNEVGNAIVVRDGQAGIGYALLALVQEVAALREAIAEGAETVREAVADSTGAEDIVEALEDIRTELAYIGDQRQADPAEPRMGLLARVRAWRYARRADRFPLLTIQDPRAQAEDAEDAGYEVTA